MTDAPARGLLEGARVLLAASLGGAGHLEPVVAIAHDLAAEGAVPTLLVPTALETHARATGLAVVVGDEPPADEVDAIRTRLAAGDDEPGLVDRELFARRCTRALLPAARSVVAAARPRLVLRESTEYASAIAGLEAGVALATVAISRAAIEHDVLQMVGPLLDDVHQGTAEAIGASPLLSAFPASLDPSPWPTTRRYRTAEPEATALPDWWPGAEGPLCYVTFGSVLGHTPMATAVLRAALGAVATLEARVLLSVGRAVDPDELGPVPANVHVERWVAQPSVLAEATVVACHGGSGTVLGALRHGVPLVIAPLYADNARNGRMVEACGAGLLSPSLRDGEPDAPAALQEGLRRVLGDPAYRRGARAIAAELASHAPITDLAMELLSNGRAPRSA